MTRLFCVSIFLYPHICTVTARLTYIVGVVIIMTVTIVRRTNILHLVHTAALRTPLDGTITADSQPYDIVAVDREARATEVLFRTERLDPDRLLECAQSAGVQRPHVEDVDPLHLTQHLESLETGRLFEIRRDRAWCRTGGQEVCLACDFCTQSQLTLF